MAGKTKAAGHQGTGRRNVEVRPMFLALGGLFVFGLLAANAWLAGQWSTYSAVAWERDRLAENLRLQEE
ncbi:MAG: hypothetical protein JRI97_08860, partial [Deltaproteobacteria bacterium]|nr:hypothetical protein [Deltaproteobacteria bacterium]